MTALVGDKGLNDVDCCKFSLNHLLELPGLFLADGVCCLILVFLRKNRRPICALHNGANKSHTQAAARSDSGFDCICGQHLEWHATNPGIQSLAASLPLL